MADALVADAPVAWPGTVEPGGDPSDLPLWDWATPEEAADPAGPEDQGSLVAQPGTARTEPPGAERVPVVTPVEQAQPGIGQRRGSLAHLSRNPRMRVWQLRAIAAAVIMVAFSLWKSWQLGLTLAVIVVIADTVIRSRRNYTADGRARIRVTAAQRRTRRQLAKLGRAGYRAMHASPIPDSEEQIDHLVIGPTGVFAIDSEAWDKHLVVRAKKGTQLWHGPFSKKDRLEHAQWEAQRAADLLSGAIGKPVTVRPAMAVYGPKIPWDVATIREVDVFSGPRLRKYLRRRARQIGLQTLSVDEIEKIFKAANAAFPHLS